ncbi:hypothetical protein FVEN_g12962 [Fusarium venenatum]|nr:hypothetical protein FVEN_g12962 [Fusarium venenatum]
MSIPFGFAQLVGLEPRARSATNVITCLCPEIVVSIHPLEQDQLSHPRLMPLHPTHVSSTDVPSILDRIQALPPHNPANETFL